MHDAIGRSMSADADHRHDVVVVGGGVAGAAIAQQLALLDVDVVVLESRSSDRPTPGSWVLTPFAVGELERLQVATDSSAGSGVRLEGIQVLSHDRTVRLPFATVGEARTIKRGQLLRELAQAAQDAGAAWRWDSAVTGPLLDDGVLVGVETSSGAVFGRIFVVADGALSHFGRALGTSRRRTRPQALVAVATIDDSAAEPRAWLDLAIDLRERFDLPVPGLGWVAPVGNHRLDVGVGVLSTYRDSDSVIIADVLSAWRAQAPGAHGDNQQVAYNTNIGRIPLGDGVWPRTGPNWLAVGDAVAMTSPLNGAGVASALSTAQLAAPIVAAAVASDDGLHLRDYETALDEHLGDELRVGRIAGRFLTEPRVTGFITKAATWSDASLARAVQLAAAADDSEPRGRLQRAVSSLARLVPEPPEHH